MQHQVESLSGPLAGIDYGSKLAGTTALALALDGRVTLELSVKGRCADTWLAEALERSRPSVIAMDAPLSLPGVYTGRGTDHHYRRCDRECGAMSPMFLGGLTARAMALRLRLEPLGATWLETYPSRVALDRLGVARDQDDVVMHRLRALLPGWQLPEPDGPHQRDALLALAAALLWMSGSGRSFGDPDEGLIWV
jgi:predicted nuclease with RNAse H fold